MNSHIDKSKISGALRVRGLDNRADWVDRSLPDRVDVVANAGLLATLGITWTDLADDHADDHEPAAGQQSGAA